MIVTILPKISVIQTSRSSIGSFHLSRGLVKKKIRIQISSSGNLNFYPEMFD